MKLRSFPLFGLISALLVSCAIIALPAAPAQAQKTKSAADAASAKRKPMTRKSQVLGKAAFQKIDKAQKLMEEENYPQALTALESVLNGASFKPYEKAVAQQTIGFVHAAKGDFQAAAAAFQTALATGTLPPRVVSDLTYNLAQLHLAEGRAAQALELLDKWFAGLDKEPRAEAYAMKAQAHVMLAQWRPGEAAINKALSKTDTPKQNWTRILLAVLLTEERYSEAKPVLEDAVVLWPEVKVFWQQLTATAYETDDEKLAFVAQQAMHVQNMLQSSRELSNMAQLYLYHNVPIKAAKLLATGMADGRIEKTEKNYELLARAYMQAREWDKSIAPLKSAAALSDAGKHYQQLAQSYVQDENWAEAEAALTKALEKGGLDKPADSWLLLGIARTRLEKYDAAIAALRKAGDDDDVARDAFRWIRSIERRLAAQRQKAADG